MTINWGEDDHTCTDFDWFQPNLDTDDSADEVLACTECGRVKWTAREVRANINQEVEKNR